MKKTILHFLLAPVLAISTILASTNAHAGPLTKLEKQAYGICFSEVANNQNSGIYSLELEKCVRKNGLKDYRSGVEIAVSCNETKMRTYDDPKNPGYRTAFQDNYKDMLTCLEERNKIANQNDSVMGRDRDGGDSGTGGSGGEGSGDGGVKLLDILENTTYALQKDYTNFDLKYPRNTK